MNASRGVGGERLSATRRRAISLLLPAIIVAAAVSVVLWLTHRPVRPSPTLHSVLRRGNGVEPESLDPQGARSEAALTVLRDVYEGLTAVGVQGDATLAGAQSVAVSDDSLTYTFTLRSGAKWSNGDAVVAEDFAAAWRRLVDPHTGAQYADLLTPVRGAAAIIAGRLAPASLGVEAVDASTLVVRLERPCAYFLRLLSHPATFPVNRRVLAAEGRGFAKPGVMVSNGAFVLTRWDFGSHLVVVRNGRYWNDAATRLDGVEYYSFNDESAELAAFRTGQLDVTAQVPAARLSWARQHLGAELHVAPQLAVYYLGLNLRKPPFATSVALRQALSLVIDREQIVRNVTGGGEAAAYTFVPPQTTGYAPPVPAYAGWPMSMRIERARELLRAAGFEHAPPTLELRYNSGELHARIAIAVAAMWKQALGVDTVLRAEEFKVLLADVANGDASVFRASWLADYDDAYSFLHVLRSSSGVNMEHYSSAAFDALLERAARTPDAQQRASSLREAEALMLSEQPVIPLYFYVSKHLVADGVEGWRSNAMNVVYSKDLAKSGPSARAGVP